jgi:hypothetical protein
MVVSFAELTDLAEELERAKNSNEIVSYGGAPHALRSSIPLRTERRTRRPMSSGEFRLTVCVQIVLRTLENVITRFKSLS